MVGAGVVAGGVVVGAGVGRSICLFWVNVSLDSLRGQRKKAPTAISAASPSIKPMFEPEALSRMLSRIPARRGWVGGSFW